jgi:hypothetical protein
MHYVCVMGYSTEFSGELLFTTPMTGPMLAEIQKFLGEDCRDHPEWGQRNLTYIDLELNDDYTGLRWDGAEKTYDLEAKVQLIIDNMCKKFPEFGLEGSLTAQGDDMDDRWILKVEGNKVSKVDVVDTNVTEELMNFVKRFTEMSPYDIKAHIKEQQTEAQELVKKMENSNG